VRKAVLGLGISLDGYIARPDGSVDFLFMPRDYSMADFFATIDCAIMGRKTFDVARKQGGGFGTMESYVLSRSQPPGKREGVTFSNEAPADLIHRLRKNKGKDIWLMGGGELAREFLKADLVDELYLGIVPVLLGEGIPLFPAGFPQRDFSLLENKSYSRGLISLKYERRRTKKKSSSRRLKRSHQRFSGSASPAPIFPGRRFGVAAAPAPCRARKLSSGRRCSAGAR